MTSENTPPRAPTGIEGLDSILGGGLPKERLYIIEGASGTGKTTLALQFCLDGVKRGEKAVYISLSESKLELEQVIQSHGWSTDGLDIISFSEYDEEQPSEEYSLFHPSEVELGQTTQRVLETVDQHKPQRLVLDTLSGLRLLADDPLRYRRQIQSLRDYLTRQGCTVLIVDEIEEEKSMTFQPRSLAHGVITLGAMTPDYGPTRRRIFVRKMRGIPYDSGYHDMRLTTGGLSIYPRLVAAFHETHYNKKRETISSGLPQVDKLLGEGLQRGGSALVMGSAGTGKSTLALHYCIAAAERGEKSLYYIFDESLDTIFARAEGLGMDPRRHIESGILEMRQVDPAEMSPGEFAHNLRGRALEGDLKLVVIDSLSGYLYAMPQERFLNLHLHELLSFLGGQGVTVLMTLIQHGLVGETVQTPAELSFLADTLILLRYFEARGEVRKAMSVFKKRAGPHEPTIRELIMKDGEGLQVGEPLKDFEAVLTGVPSYVGSERGELL